MVALVDEPIVFSHFPTRQLSTMISTTILITTYEILR
jgi:hypothetical protein